MPKGPPGEKRPADVIGAAVRVAKIATREIENSRCDQPAKRKGGLAGAKARAATLAPTRRSQIARKAAEARWAAKRSSG